MAAGSRSAGPRPAVGGFERPPSLAGLRVLVVDDDEDARQLVRAVLEECGCIVRTVESVGAAMAAFDAEVPDVLVSDIGMPEQDGYVLIRKVRALPASRGGTVPAVALTAYARADDRRRVLSEGFMMHVPAELVTVVANLTRFFAQRQR
jgi:CheY-like chemotaxis protein